MNTRRASCQVIPFPPAPRWSKIAREYVDYMTSSDPRAGFFYLEYQLHKMRLSDVSAGLREAIDGEYRRRGFTGPLDFYGAD